MLQYLVFDYDNNAQYWDTLDEAVACAKEVAVRLAKNGFLDVVTVLEVKAVATVRTEISVELLGD